MPRYSKRYSRRRFPRPYGTRYYSTRPVTGMYRSSSKLMLTGRARRLFSQRRLKKALYAIAEHKFFDIGTTFISGTNGILNTGTITPITDMAQGLLDTTRIGDKVTGLSLELNISVESPGSVNQNVIFNLRAIVFIWKDDTAPTTFQVLQAYTGGITSPTYMYPLNHDQSAKRKIIFDKRFTTAADHDGTSTISMSRPGFTRKYLIPLSNLKGGLNVQEFQAATATAIKGINILLISDASTQATTWDVYLHTRYNYVDM